MLLLFFFSQTCNPTLSLSPSFNGLVVGAIAVSQCEMCCCGDDMIHFTLEWGCIIEERENKESRAEGSSLSAIEAGR